MKGHCKHYRASHIFDTCQVGVWYSEVTPDFEKTWGRMKRMPCRKLSAWTGEPVKQGVCEKYEERTPEEEEQEKRDMQEAMDQVEMMLPLLNDLRKKHKHKDWSGTLECPKCKGVLHVSHCGYNGHIWAKCKTENCITWAE